MQALQKDPNKYWVFHKDIGHWIKDCRNIKWKIEQLLSEGHLGANENKNIAPWQENRRDNPRRDVIPLNPPQREYRKIQPSQANIYIIYTIHGGLTMLKNTHNSHKRYARESRDTHHPIYTLMHEGTIFLIRSKRNSTLSWWSFSDHSQSSTLRDA